MKKIIFLVLLVAGLSIVSAFAAKEHYTFIYRDPLNNKNSVLVLKDGFWEMEEGKAPIYSEWKEHITFNSWGEYQEMEVSGVDPVYHTDNNGRKSIQVYQRGRIENLGYQERYTDLTVFSPSGISVRSSLTYVYPRSIDIITWGITLLVTHKITGGRVAKNYTAYEHIVGHLWEISKHRKPATPPDYCQFVNEYGWCFGQQ